MTTAVKVRRVKDGVEDVRCGWSCSCPLALPAGRAGDDRGVHEFELIHRGVGLVLCVLFPGLVLAMTVLYTIAVRRDARRRAADGEQATAADDQPRRP